MKSKRKFVIQVIIASLIYVICLSINAFYVDALKNNDDKKLILIDPGHGGHDAGASSKSGIKEKDINLSISLKLRDKLKDQGFQVMLTREEDIALLSGKRVKSKKAEDLANRCKMKKDSKCDLFISIHQNIFTESQYHGAQVWYAQSEESRKIAHLLQGNLREDLDKNNNRVEKAARDDIRVLRCSIEIPSVLVECGFLSNVEEALKLKDNQYQDKVADSIARTIKQHFENIQQ